MKKSLILIPSVRMDGNKKGNRYEDKLIRIGSKARTYLELDDEKLVELWPTNTPMDRINRSKTLDIYKAFSADLKEVKNGNINPEEYLRVGFVTTRTYNYICGNGADSNSDIWISQCIEDTVVGGDPEFILINSENKAQYAQEVNGFNHIGKLASDGPLAEIRPDPTIDANDFVNNIKEILSSHPHIEVIKPFEWRAACCWTGGGQAIGRNRDNWPVGGHIHIGTPSQVAIKAGNSENFKNFYYITLTRILDELLGIPLMRFDDKNENIYRRSKYGKYGGHRTDHGRLEYRTLSGMWMAHPELATITLNVAKAIIDAYFQMVESNDFNVKYLCGNEDSQVDCFDPRFNRWDTIGIMKDMGTIKSSSEMINILHNHKMVYSKQYIIELKEKLHKLPTYTKYAKYIDALLELMSIPYTKIRSLSTNLKETWLEGKEFII